MYLNRMSFYFISIAIEIKGRERWRQVEMKSFDKNAIVHKDKERVKKYCRGAINSMANANNTSQYCRLLLSAI